MATRPSDYHNGWDKLTDKQLLEKCRRGWVSNETPCGTGSEHRNTENVKRVLKDVVARYGIESVCDAGAGDLHWIPELPNYRAFDLYPRKPSVIQWDITKMALPECDLILCRHVLNHLSVRMAKDALSLFALSGKYLLMTMCENQRNYWDTFGFHYGEPIETFDDCQHWRLELHCLMSSA